MEAKLFSAWNRPATRVNWPINCLIIFIVWFMGTPCPPTIGDEVAPIWRRLNKREGTQIFQGHEIDFEFHDGGNLRIDCAFLVMVVQGLPKFENSKPPRLGVYTSRIKALTEISFWFGVAEINVFLNAVGMWPDRTMIE